MTTGDPTSASIELREKLGVLLGALRELETGQARIANLLIGLRAGHVHPTLVRSLVEDLWSYPINDEVDAYHRLLDRIRERHPTLYFKRPSPPVWERQVAVVLESPLFDQGAAAPVATAADMSAEQPSRPFRLFSDHYVSNARALRLVPDRVTNAIELADLLEYLREGLRAGLAGAGLGAAGRVVFITPVDEFWEGLTAQRFRSARDPYPELEAADRICDYLGLPYRRDWLVELRSRHTLGQLVEEGKLALAAPTVIEAWGHDYFRHWPRGAAPDPWGRTLYAKRGAIGRGEPDGLREAIIDHLSATQLSEAFEVSILGRLTDRPVPQQDEINQVLVEKPNLTAWVDEIITRVVS